ncbi:hypothetical protein [Cylindrospermopsis raciborskii]|uniref:hypothetical protein n=1 Tax=Cylindrospermopsis raciborskii TaxID=77022 RepID=UPI001114CD27|nr:hypothetical protein [Cylindrospermopsis raciborskii]NLQ05902.1 hypothetical protein [Cylindrospermopsis raciborskii MVCC19]
MINFNAEFNRRMIKLGLTTRATEITTPETVEGKQEPTLPTPPTETLSTQQTVRFLLGSGINGNLLEEALEGDEYKEKAKYLEILRVQADEIERANQEMDKQLDKEFADQIASGKAAAAKEIAKMNAYDDHMRAFREALAKGKSKKD